MKTSKLTYDKQLHDSYAIYSAINSRRMSQHATRMNETDFKNTFIDNLVGKRSYKEEYL
jgi:hypothetical protein